MGLVDGPGIRVVVFIQGCKLRCLYCHNPDTWNKNKGDSISSKELLDKVKKYKPYFENSGGGVTLSGGDPLLQPEFIKEFFKMCREEGIHTCLDTSGFGLGDYDEILKYTDLVLLDIKHIDEEKHMALTGQPISGINPFLDALKKSNTKIWIRHVVVEGYTDEKEHIKSFGKLIKDIPNVEMVELLPYHTHGVNKYESLGIEYRLKGLSPLSSDKLKELKSILKEILRDTNIKLH